MNQFLTKRVAKWTYDFSTLATSAVFNAAQIDETADTITIANHPFKTGDMVSVYITPSTGVTATTPALSTAYYIIYVNKNTVGLATSAANAYAGTKAALTAGSAANLKLIKDSFGAVKTGIILPAGAIVTGGFIDVKTTFQSYDGTNTDAATLAFSSSVGAADLQAAVAISTGTTWDADSTYTLIPGTVVMRTVAGDTAALGQAAEGAALIELTADGEVTMSIGVDPLTAGKLDLYVEFIA